MVGGLRRWWMFEWVHRSIVELYKAQIAEKDARIEELKHERDEARDRALTAVQTTEHQASTLRAVVPMAERLDALMQEIQALKDEST